MESRLARVTLHVNGAFVVQGRERKACCTCRVELVLLAYPITDFQLMSR